VSTRAELADAIATELANGRDVQQLLGPGWPGCQPGLQPTRQVEVLGQAGLYRTPRGYLAPSKNGGACAAEATEGHTSDRYVPQLPTAGHVCADPPEGYPAMVHRRAAEQRRMPVSRSASTPGAANGFSSPTRSTFHNNRRVVALEFGRDRSLELDVEDDARLMEEIAEALLKVLGDVGCPQGRPLRSSGGQQRGDYKTDLVPPRAVPRFRLLRDRGRAARADRGSPTRAYEGRLTATSEAAVAMARSLLKGRRHERRRDRAGVAIVLLLLTGVGVVIWDGVDTAVRGWQALEQAPARPSRQGSRVVMLLGIVFWLSAARPWASLSARHQIGRFFLLSRSRSCAPEGDQVLLDMGSGSCC